MPATRLEENAMNMSPRQRDDYTGRQIEAARRVLLDVGQILSSFRDSMVIVGGWVPDLLLAGTAEIHVGSIDVDIALDARKLELGLYANLLELLLETRRFERGDREFRFVSKVDLDDGMDAVAVEVDFLAASDLKIKGKNKLPGFRVLQADACEFAFRAPVGITLSGTTPTGAQNSVRLRVVSLPDFLVMKAHAGTNRRMPTISASASTMPGFPNSPGLGEIRGENASRKRWRFCVRNSPARIPTARCKSWNFILHHPPMNAPSSQDAHSNWFRRSCTSVKGKPLVK
jgi:hypothetical protein